MLIEAQPNFVVAEAADGQGAMDAARRTIPTSEA